MNLWKVLALLVFFFFSLGCTGQESNKNQDKVRGTEMSDQQSTFSYDKDLWTNPFKFEKTKSARSLFKDLTVKKENQVFSPLSLEAVLTLLAVGASGDSLQALNQFLELESEKPMHHLKYLQKSFDFMMKAKNPIAEELLPEVSLGFGIAASDKYPIDKEKVNEVKHEVDLFLKTFDFKNNGNQATDEINAWVATKTNDKIKKLLEKIEPSTAMILLNTLFFKSPWLDPFKENFTAPMAFTTDSGETIQVSTMKQQARFEYVENEVYQGLHVPLKASDMKFWFFRPKKSPQEVIEHLSSNSLMSQLNTPEHREVILHLPKFKIEANLNLTKTLKKHGLEILTKSPNMEINGFFADKKDFIVSQAIQGNFFAIDEKGVEAASATALAMMAGGPPPAKPMELKFDKPFVFLMFQPSTGRMAFAGQVYQPEKP